MSGDDKWTRRTRMTVLLGLLVACWSTIIAVVLP